MDYHYYRGKYPDELRYLFTLKNPSPEFEKIMLVSAVYGSVYDPILVRESEDGLDRQSAVGITMVPRPRIELIVTQHLDVVTEINRLGSGFPNRPIYPMYQLRSAEQTTEDILTWYAWCDGVDRFDSQEAYNEYINGPGRAVFTEFYRRAIRED